MVRPEVGKVFAAVGQVVMDEQEAYVCCHREKFFVEAFAGIVAVWIDVEGIPVFEKVRFREFALEFLLVEQCCRRDGYCFVAGGEHCPAVAASFCDVEVFSWAQHLQDGEVVDVAAFALREAESRLRWVCAHVAALDADELPVLAIIWNLQGVAEGVQAAIPDDSRMQVPFAIEELAGIGREPGMLEVACVAAGIEKTLPNLPVRGGTFIVSEDDVMLVCEPSAGFEERVVGEDSHGQAYRVAAGSAGKAFVFVAGNIEGETRRVVVVEWAEAFVSVDAEPQPPCDSLYGEVAELLDFIAFHISRKSFRMCRADLPLRISTCA